MGIERLELACLHRQFLDTATQGTNPNVAPLILGDRPYIVIKQLTASIGHGVVFYLSVGDVDKSTIICTKPH